MPINQEDITWDKIPENEVSWDKEISHEKLDFNNQVHPLNMDEINQANNIKKKEPSSFKSAVNTVMSFLMDRTKDAKDIADEIALPISDSIQKNQDAFIKPLVENDVTKPIVKAVEDTANFFTPIGEFDFASKYSDDKKSLIDEAIKENDLPIDAYNKINKLAKTQTSLTTDNKQGLETYNDNLANIIIDDFGFDDLGIGEDGKYYAVKGENQIQLNKDTLKEIVSDVYGDKMEVLSAVIGAKSGYDLTKGKGKKIQALASVVGGASGASIGNAIDMLDSAIETGEKLSGKQVADEMLKAAALDATAGVVTAGVVKGVGKVAEVNPFTQAKRAEAYKNNILDINNPELKAQSEIIEEASKEFGGKNNQELTVLSSHDETQKVLEDIYDNSYESRKANVTDSETLKNNLFNKLNIEEVKLDETGNINEKISENIKGQVSGIEDYWSSLYTQTKDDIVQIAGNENIKVQPSVIKEIDKNLKSLQTLENVQKRKISQENVNEFQKDYNSMLNLIEQNLKREVPQADGTIKIEDVDSYTLTGMMDLQKKFNDFYYKHDDKLTASQKKNLNNVKTKIYDDIDKYISFRFNDNSEVSSNILKKWKDVNSDFSTWKKTKGRHKILQDIIDSKVDIKQLTKGFINNIGDVDKSGLDMLGNIGQQLGKAKPEKLDEFYGSIVNNIISSSIKNDTQFGKTVSYMDFEQFNKVYDSLKGKTLNKTFGQTKRGREIIKTLNNFRTISKNEEKIQNAVFKKQTMLSESGRTSKEATRDFLFGIGYAIRHRVLGFMSSRMFKADAYHSIVTDMSKKTRYSLVDFEDSIKKLELENEKLPSNKKYLKEEIDELKSIRIDIDEYRLEREEELRKLEELNKEIADKEEKENLLKEFRKESERKAQEIDIRKSLNTQKNKEMALDYQISKVPESKPESQIAHESILNETPAVKRMNEFQEQIEKADKSITQYNLEKSKKRTLNALESIRNGESKKEIIELVDDAERDEILAHFNLELKHPNNFTRTIDKSQVEHVLKNHGNVEKEAKRGNIALDENDIAKYIDIVHDFDMREFTTNRQGKPTVVYGKQDDGYFVVVEEIRTGKSDLAFFTMRKTKGELTEGALIPNSKSQASRPKTTPSASKDSISKKIEKDKI